MESVSGVPGGQGGRQGGPKESTGASREAKNFDYSKNKKKSYNTFDKNEKQI